MSQNRDTGMYRLRMFVEPRLATGGRRLLEAVVTRPLYQRREVRRPSAMLTPPLYLDNLVLQVHLPPPSHTL